MLKNRIIIKTFSMKNFLQIAAIIILSIICINQYIRKNELAKTIELNELAEKDTIQYFTNKLGLEVAEKKAYKGTVKELDGYLQAARDSSKQFAEATKEWKKIANALQVEIEFKADAVDIPFDTPINFEFTRNFYKKTSSYTFSGEVNQFGLNINAFAKATITPITGMKTTGLFSSDFSTEITSSNNLIKVADFSSFNFIEKKKRFGIGFSLGFGLYQNGFFVGPSINYNLIQF
ncbi:hypothetical protein Leef1_12 [Polaribacter phage Leef_1]|uniref:Uncharacterized protein n=1 Tax=Polaribacter phage Leef_1 TaxID=2745684 RepID=A0A8E5E9P8_9CAUD|nr:hypothetical protein M1M28_gp12 [Polaribacter phage Leef_1]QQV91375.1 hypothetical protein Leef1_12 [Polaribacter phage Leef_1]